MNLFSGLAEGQVLQRRGSRGATVTIEGTCEENALVLATISQKNIPLKGWKARSVGQVKKGKFKIQLIGIPAGGPYRLLLRAGKSQMQVESFFVGDVWLLAGQSNMEGCGSMTTPAKPHPLVRSFSMARVWRLATDPLHVLPESPDACHAATPCTPEEAERLRKKAVAGAGVGVFFGREMVKRSGVPQGLICVAHGGTSMLQWNPARKNEKGASLYGSLLLSMRATGQPIAGVLWYQGESDTNPQAAELYTSRMKRLIAASRRDLAEPKLPWIMVQISRVFSRDLEPNATSWNQIQNEQRLLPERVPNVEIVSSIDLPLDDLIHIGTAGFPRLANRLARAADRLVHGNRLEKTTPRLKAIQKPRPTPIGGSTIDVLFDHVNQELQAQGEPSGFTMIDQEGRDLKTIFKVTLHGNMARLHLTSIPQESHKLIYGHGLTPYANITDGAGRALLCFAPASVQKPGFLPFVTTWKKTEVVTNGPALNKITVPDMEAVGMTPTTYQHEAFPGFIDEHVSWEGKSGQAYFSARVELSEAMQLEFLMGYDGPFRLWIDEKSFWDALEATNPCFPDEGIKSIALTKGKHRLRIAMDLNEGLAWGFCLRLRRLDLTPKQIKSGKFPKPIYSF
jgi:Carbohydrate esterase, sialic acid-specific acetylesterase